MNTIWKVGYCMETVENGETSSQGPLWITMLATDDVRAVQAQLDGRLVGRVCHGELDGEKWSSRVVGVRIIEAVPVATLTDWKDVLADYDD